jgi:hypothetical protein
VIKRSHVTFERLRQILLDLGFTEAKRGKFWYFEHEPSGTIFGFRPYRLREKVTAIDMVHVRTHLDWRGVLEEQSFDNMLEKASA